MGLELVENEDIMTCLDAKENLSMLKELGYKIYIDDFGSGYSNFAYLTKIDIDYLKIDGALISNIDVDKNSYLVVESIVDFAKKFGIKSIAEHVHSSTVMDKVKELDIEYSQGYYIDMPSLDLDML